VLPTERDQNTKRRGVIARVYIDVLREYLPIILEHNSIFMQDNALIHKAYKIREFFLGDRDRYNRLVAIFAGLKPYRKPLENTKSRNQQNIS
jgi:hypothetical protein